MFGVVLMTFLLSWRHRSTDTDRGTRTLQLSESVTVGREAGVDIQLKDDAVSRLHAEIWADQAGVHFRDRGSSNGLFINGKRAQEAIWSPGDKLDVGPFVLEIEALAAGTIPRLQSIPEATPLVPSQINVQDPPRRGRIQLGEVYKRAKKNDPHAIGDLFQGFLGRTEHVVDCGYLGAYGLILPSNCFWCVTDRRVCGMIVNYAGWVHFQFGFIKSLNRATFNQPSLVMLWLIVIFWLLFALSVFWETVFHLFSAGLLAGLLGLLATAAIVALTPFVVWLYYRYEKAGCVYWTVELVPIWIFSDRHSIHSAQRFISVFMDQKQILGD